MPEMSGRELADKLTKLIPGVKSIYMSDYISDVLRDDVLRDETRSLQKPFTVSALAMKVSKVLGSPDLRTSD